jgi:peptidoglycan-associated lipoprotein
MANIFFKFGSWELSPESEEGLKALAKLLSDNPNITIELAAHTDMVGNNTANQELSLKRAQSVVTYLVSMGIEKDRLTAVGYGEEKPVVVDETLNKQYPYLPKDQVLDEAFINTLTTEQQDVCNSLNRRTEFRVLKTTYNLY